MSSTRYTSEFKDEAIKQVTERGYSISEVSERLGISAHSLYKWVEVVIPDKSGEIADEFKHAKQEILRLKAELYCTQDERDILKKDLLNSYA